MFPALVILAWMADAKKFCFDDSDRELHSKLLEVRGPDGQPITQDKLIMLSKIVKAKYFPTAESICFFAAAVLLCGGLLDQQISSDYE